MKEKYIRPSFLVIMAILIGGLYSCEKSDEYRDPVSTDKSKPGVVTNVRVKNYNGAAVISYDLPDHQDLLYVMADYSIRDGVNRQIKSSYFLDTMKLDGFNKSKDYTVTLRAVTRANAQSDPVTVTVHPADPYYELVRKSLGLTDDYGGIRIKASNAAQSAIAINTLAIDPVTNKFAIVNEHYTSIADISFSLRGYSPKPTKFGVYISDRFGNVSDTAVVTINPKFEELLKKTNFFNYPQPSDAVIGYGGVVPNIWDGNITEDNGANAWQTTIGTSQKLMQCTFGIGQTSYKLTHFVMNFRDYGGNNPKNFTIYGSNADNPDDAVTPGGMTIGTELGDWVVLGNFRVPDPPSGLPQGKTNAADRAYVNNGIDFSIQDPDQSPKVKYIRIVVQDTWFGLDYTIIREVTFFGVPQ